MTTTVHAPRNLADALELLEEYSENATPLAGGTDLLVAGLLTDAVISLHRIRELGGIHRSGSRLIVGATATHDDIAASPEIGKYLPCLRDAARSVGSPQIRNRGTIGGNLANASPAGDLLPPLYANEAVLNIVSKNEQRNVRIFRFFTGPGKTVLQRGELIKSITIPIPEGKSFQCFLKMGQRGALAISKISLALCADRLRKNGAGPMKERIRIAFGAVAPTVVRAHETERILTGRLNDDEAIDRAVETVKREVSPIGDIRSSRAYRREMASVLARDAVNSLAEYVRRKL